MLSVYKRSYSSRRPETFILLSFNGNVYERVAVLSLGNIHMTQMTEHKLCVSFL